MTQRDRILMDALELPSEDRAFVVDRLEQSLGHEHFASQEIVRAWNTEIDRRILAYERRELVATEADESLVRMQRLLAEHRARKAHS